MAGYTYGDMGGCNCPSSTFAQTFKVFGCNSLAYQGVTVSVYTSSGGSLLASGATSSSGQVALSWSGGGNVYVTVTGQSTRFQAFGQSYALATGGTTTIVLAVASGYVCLPGCLLPVATTIHLSASSGATATVTYNGTYWTGPGTYTYAGCGSAGCGCAGASLTVRWYWYGASTGLITLYGYVSGDCPAAGTSGTFVQLAGGGSVAVTCPPSFQAATTVALADESPAGCFYCGGAGDTVTMTE